MNGPEVQVPPRVAVALTLAIHELATNALKYGALSDLEGRVELSWQFLEKERPPELHLRWEETGGPIVVQPERKGFGSTLIQRVLASEIGGSALIEYRPTGVVFKAVAPLTELHIE